MKLLVSVAIMLFVAIYILPLGVRPLATPDETRYAEVPREMIASGDWVTPTLDGLPYFEKPVLGYWLNAASILIFGHNNFAIRFPAAIATGLASLCVFMLVRCFSGESRSGILASMMYLTSVLVFGVGTYNVLDAPFSMLLTLALTCFYLASDGKTPMVRQRLLLVLFGVFCGLAFLTKGFLAFVLPVIVIAPYMLWQRRLSELIRMAPTPLFAAALVAAPWAIAICIRQPDYWHYFFWVEHIQRFVKPSADQHDYPFWYFAPILLAGALPWTSLAGCTLKGLQNLGFSNSLTRFCICWLVIPFVLFSLSSGKLATYILPCFVPLTILTTMGLQKYLESDSPDFRNWCRNVIIILVLVILCVVLVRVLPLPEHISINKHLLVTRIYSESENGKYIAFIMALAAYIFVLFRAMRAQDTYQRMLFVCIGPMFLLAPAPFLLPSSTFDGKSPGSVMERHVEGLSPSVLVVTDKYTVSAACWYYKRSDVYIVGSPGELAYGASSRPSPSKVIPQDKFASFLEAREAGTEVMLITPPDRFEDYKLTLPQPHNITVEAGYVVAHFVGTASLERTGSVEPIQTPQK
jgi:4-amino-4-deoxy-L-arabinose transferase